MLAELEDRVYDGERALARSHSGYSLTHSNRVGKLRGVITLEFGLVIEQIHLRRRARLMKEDDPFSFRGEVRKSGDSASLRVSARLSIGERDWLEQRSESGDPDASACEAEELASRQGE